MECIPNKHEKRSNANHFWIAELEGNYLVLVNAPKGNNNEEYVKQQIDPLFKPKIIKICSMGSRKEMQKFVEKEFNVDIRDEDLDYVRNNRCPRLFKF